MGIDCSSHTVTIFENRAPQIEELKRMIGDRYSMGREEGTGDKVRGGGCSRRGRAPCQRSLV